MRSSIVVRSEAARIRRSREAFAAAGPCDSTSRTRVSAATSDRGDGMGLDHRHHLVEELALRGLARECSGQQQ